MDIKRILELAYVQAAENYDISSDLFFESPSNEKKELLYKASAELKELENLVKSFM